MRTYGVHGGERQLCRMFVEELPGVIERFVFVYRDYECEGQFATAKRLRMHRLWPWPIAPRASAWRELLLVLLCLPWLQTRLLWLLLKHRTCACVVHGFQAALVAWPSALLMRHVGFAYVHRSAKSRRGRHPLFRLLYRPFRIVAGVSSAVAASLAELAPGARVEVIANGIDADRLRHSVANRRERPEGAFVVCAIGRLLPDKGYPLVLSAFANVLSELPSSQLWIAGDGTERENLERTARSLGIADAVRFLGHVDDIAAVLSVSDAFVHASEAEGMSNAVLEAMAMGRASVVVDAPGVSECHVSGETGFVVDRNPVSVAAALMRIAADRALCNRMGRAAEARVRSTYSIQANRATYHQLYVQLCSAGE